MSAFFKAVASACQQAALAAVLGSSKR